MNAGRKNSKANIGIHGHAGGTRPGQTRKTPKNLSAHESEERGREESGREESGDIGRLFSFFGWFICS